MKLAELEPRWLPWGGIPQAVLMFRCPCCRKTWLTCTLVAISISDQIDLHEAAAPDVEHSEVAPCREGAVWRASGVPSFAQLDIEPSIDASAAGHWHGFIRHGEIIG